MRAIPIERLAPGRHFHFQWNGAPAVVVRIGAGCAVVRGQPKLKRIEIKDRWTKEVCRTFTARQDKPWIISLATMVYPR